MGLLPRPIILLLTTTILFLPSPSGKYYNSYPVQEYFVVVVAVRFNSITVLKIDRIIEYRHIRAYLL